MVVFESGASVEFVFGASAIVIVIVIAVNVNVIVVASFLSLVAGVVIGVVMVVIDSTEGEQCMSYGAPESRPIRTFL